MVKWRWKCRQKLPRLSLEVCSMWLPKRPVCTMCIWARASLGGSLFPLWIDQNMKKRTARGKGILQQQCSQSCAQFESRNHTSNIPFQRHQHHATTPAVFDKKGKARLGWTHCLSTRLELPGSKCHSICAFQGVQCCHLVLRPPTWQGHRTVRASLEEAQRWNSEDWNTSPVKTGWESSRCSARRREGSRKAL